MLHRERERGEKKKKKEWKEKYVQYSISHDTLTKWSLLLTRHVHMSYIAKCNGKYTESLFYPEITSHS